MPAVAETRRAFMGIVNWIFHFTRTSSSGRYMVKNSKLFSRLRQRGPLTHPRIIPWASLTVCQPVRWLVYCGHNSLDNFCEHRFPWLIGITLSAKCERICHYEEPTPLGIRHATGNIMLESLLRFSSFYIQVWHQSAKWTINHKHESW